MSSSKNRKNRKNRNKGKGKDKNKIETSKIFTAWALIIVSAFIIWCCYEMHITGDLSALAYIAPATLAFGAICLRAYCTRAVNKDLAHLTVNKSEGLSKLKKKYQDDFVYNEAQFVEDNSDWEN